EELVDLAAEVRAPSIGKSEHLLRGFSDALDALERHAAAGILYDSVEHLAPFEELLKRVRVSGIDADALAETQGRIAALGAQADPQAEGLSGYLKTKRQRFAALPQVNELSEELRGFEAKAGDGKLFKDREALEGLDDLAERIQISSANPADLAPLSYRLG